MTTRPSGRNLVLDLGTSKVRLAYVTLGKYPAEGDARPPVIEIPALTLMDATRHTVVALGTQAADIARATLPSGVEAVRPLRAGRVAAFDAAVALVRAALHAALGGESALRRLARRPRALYTLPATATDVDRIVMQDVLRAAGFGTTSPVPLPLATAHGVGLAVQAKRPRAMCDIGAGLVKATVVAGGQVQIARSWPLGGDWLDQAITRAVRHRRGITMTRQMAEEARRASGVLADDYDYRAPAGAPPATLPAADDAETRLIQKRRGRGTGELLAKVGAGGTFGQPGGSPRNRSRVPEFHTTDVETGLAEGARVLIERLVWFWEDLDPGMRAAVEQDGLVLTGGAAQVPGLPAALARALHAPVHLAVDPERATIRGLIELGSDRAAWGATWTWSPDWETGS